MLPFKIATFFITFWIRYFFFSILTFSHILRLNVRIQCYMVSENQLSKPKWNQSFINKRIKKQFDFSRNAYTWKQKKIHYYKIKPCKLSIFIDYQIDRLIIQEFINGTLSMYIKWTNLPLYLCSFSISISLFLWAFVYESPDKCNVVFFFCTKITY